MPQNDSITAMKPCASTWIALATRRTFQPATKLAYCSSREAKARPAQRSITVSEKTPRPMLPTDAVRDPAELLVVAAHLVEELGRISGCSAGPSARICDGGISR